MVGEANSTPASLGDVDARRAGGAFEVGRSDLEHRTRITGGGCALGAFCAGMIAVHDDPFEAAIAAHGFYGLAAEKALENSTGPGSFAVAFIDALSATDPEELKTLKHEELNHA